MANNPYSIPPESLQAARKAISDVFEYLDSLKSELKEMKAQIITT